MHGCTHVEGNSSSSRPGLSFAAECAASANQGQGKQATHFLLISHIAVALPSSLSHTQRSLLLGHLVMMLPLLFHFAVGFRKGLHIQNFCWQNTRAHSTETKLTFGLRSTCKFWHLPQGDARTCHTSLRVRNRGATGDDTGHDTSDGVREVRPFDSRVGEELFMQHKQHMQHRPAKTRCYTSCGRSRMEAE